VQVKFKEFQVNIKARNFKKFIYKKMKSPMIVSSCSSKRPLMIVSSSYWWFLSIFN